MAPGLTSSFNFTLNSVNTGTNTWVFGYSISNTSSNVAPGVVGTSRIIGFGFNTDPELNQAGTSITGSVFDSIVFGANIPGNPPGLGVVDFCGTVSGCPGGGGGGDGLFQGQNTIGTFTLDFAGSGMTSIDLTDFFVRYQGIVADGFGTSGVGLPGGSVQFASVPGPVVGAGLPALLVALGGLVGLQRRRRKLVA